LVLFGWEKLAGDSSGLKQVAEKSRGDWVLFEKCPQGLKPIFISKLLRHD
jgi:hypothetical protein